MIKNIKILKINGQVIFSKEIKNINNLSNTNDKYNEVENNEGISSRT